MQPKFAMTHLEMLIMALDVLKEREVEDKQELAIALVQAIALEKHHVLSTGLPSHMYPMPEELGGQE